MNILIVEDDAEMRAFIVRGLREAGEAVTEAADASSALLLASGHDYDVIVFDRMLPGMDGMDATRVLRETGNQTPVLLLTAMSRIDDRVLGLEAGADDYMVKPFAFSELHARLKALARRRPIVEQSTSLSVGNLYLDRLQQKAWRGDHELDLMPREYRILEFLMENEGQLVTKTMLLEKIWGYNFNPRTSLVQTHLSRLRAKVDKPFEVDLIHTVRGSGYVIRAD
ncbi:MAG: response regulator transcription factor [Pseudomonadota bacterium]